MPVETIHCTVHIVGQPKKNQVQFFFFNSPYRAEFKGESDSDLISF